MFTFGLQDRVTLLMKQVTTADVQAESAWLDLQGYQDLVCWTEVTERTSGTTASLALNFETSPTLDDAQFRTMIAVNLLTFSVGTVTANRVLAWTASVPLARYVRWRVTKDTNEDVRFTFRLYVSANCVDRKLMHGAG